MRLFEPLLAFSLLFLNILETARFEQLPALKGLHEAVEQVYQAYRSVLCCEASNKVHRMYIIERGCMASFPRGRPSEGAQPPALFIYCSCDCQISATCSLDVAFYDLMLTLHNGCISQPCMRDGA